MKLIDMLKTPGTHVWAFTRETPIKTIGDAHRRLQSYLVQDRYQHVKAEATGSIMTDVKNYSSEPVLVITVTHKG